MAVRDRLHGVPEFDEHGLHDLSHRRLVVHQEDAAAPSADRLRTDARHSLDGGLGHRQIDGEARALAHIRGHLDVTAVLADNRVARRQAEPRSLCLGGEERLENAGLDLSRNARPLITHGHTHIASGQQGNAAVLAHVGVLGD